MRRIGLALVVGLGVGLGAGVCAQRAFAQAHPEWTLFTAYSASGETFLVNLGGNVVKTWQSAFAPGASVYLIDDGAILRTANDPSVATFGGPGVGGRIERIGWDGTVEWSYVAAGTGAGRGYVQHHDIEPLPNGNVLAIVWERYTRSEAIAMGRDPAGVGGEVWSEAILEIRPEGATGGEIVWEWRVWDHLVQDFDPGLPNYGEPAAHPGRIDINYGNSGSDWLHFNAIAYSAELDQIVVSVRAFDEIWIISHDPAHSGELLYRWGNPEAYGRGGPGDRRLFGQHDPEWIPAGHPGAGNLTIFNNGAGRGHASIVELDTGVVPGGMYTLPAHGAYGPAGFVSECDEIDGQRFTSPVMSGVQRLRNGNSLICLSTAGRLVEVDAACNTVWSHDTGVTTFRGTRIEARDSRLRGLLWCYADCDGSGGLDVFDFLCFQEAFVQGAMSADCDKSGGLDVFDFLCFQDEFIAGCP